MGPGERVRRVRTCVYEVRDPAKTVQVGEPKGRVCGRVLTDGTEHSWSGVDVEVRGEGRFLAGAVGIWSGLLGKALANAFPLLLARSHFGSSLSL